jgi:flagellin-like protein
MGFRGANRGQSEVIGAILIFAIIVTLIGINQAFIVPDANADVEFQHNNDVQRDMVNLRSGTTEAAASNEPRSRSIALGTDYPTRFVAVNPPDPTGSFRTVSGGDISASHSELDLSNVCGTGSDDPSTKFLRYEPNYNEYHNANPITIENTVTYRETGGSPLFNTGQFFAQDSQINIIRYVGDFEETSTRTASVDLIPSETGVADVNTSAENLTVTLPSDLESDDWSQIVDTSGVNISNNGSDAVDFTFHNDRIYTVRCTTVGINEDPNVSPADLTDDGGDTAQGINPNADGEIVLVSTENVSNNGAKDVSIDLEDKTNTGGTVNITGARLNFYSSTSTGHSPSDAGFLTLGGQTYTPGGEFKPLDTEIEIDGTETVELKFDEKVEGDDFYVLSLEFSNGDVNTYFISHRNSNPGGGSG